MRIFWDIKKAFMGKR